MPRCGTEIPFTEAITHQIEERLRGRLDEELREREQHHAEALATKEVELVRQHNAHHMSAGAVWLWFLSCYSPLFFLVAIRALAVQNRTFAFVCIAVGLVSIASGWVSMRLADPPTTVKVARVSVHDADVPAYLMTYVVPFVGVTAEGWLDALVLIIVLGLVGMFYVQGSLRLPNPTVQVFGYRWLLLDVDGKSLNVLASAKARRRLTADSVAIGTEEPRAIAISHIGSQIWLVRDA